MALPHAYGLSVSGGARLLPIRTLCWAMLIVLLSLATVHAQSMARLVVLGIALVVTLAEAQSTSIHVLYECCVYPVLQATPVEILPWVVRRWSVEVTFEEARAHLGVETQRQWSDQAIARTTPVLLALFSLVTVLALQLAQDEPIPVPVTAWYHKAEPTFADCLALVRRHLWRARYLVNSAPEPEFVQFAREAFDLWLTGLPSAA